MKARTAVIVLAVAAVLIAIVVTAGSGGGKGKSGTGGGSATKPASDAIRVSFAYSPEKQKLIQPLIEKFNAEGRRSAGRPVFIDGQVVSSGDAETKIAKRQLQPVLWSPASSLWGRLLNFEGDRSWVPDTNPSIVRTPLLIAMWEPLARALGWPRKPIGFADVLRLALDRRGLGAYGHPEYGRFKLGHTNPDFSTSGLSAVAAEYSAVTGKKEGLTLADVDRPEVRRKIQAIERSIIHYGDTTLFFADQLRRYGPAYASAVAMEEATLIDFNQKRGGAGTKLVGIYPAEGTFYSDNPLITLQAPWVTDQQKAAARVFADWLGSRISPTLAASQGFRPREGAGRTAAPIDAAHGADPNQPTRLLSLPEPRVLAKVKTTWRSDRKPANIALVVDTSGSMSEENKLDQAKQGLRVFLSQLSPNDRVGLITFNDKVFRLSPISPFGSSRTKLLTAVNGLFPDGQTAVYDATTAGVQEVQKLKDASRINAVVVLTDGEDNQSSTSSNQVVSALQRQATSEGMAIRVYTIAYGSAANQDVLTQIASASGGKEYAGDPKQIESVYRSISSFF
ncbi:MAG TPA: VWA domain-containing protein [Solirubrobacteraceae bacterium]|nr:VWA domain-containing protein [Solirubrobacteraceae bacterium]